ncbi:MAG: type II toxin-antitoxin system HicA family toxin [Thermoplasmatota archaeon]
MSRLRPIDARRLVKFLVRHGFHVAGQSGSHVKLKRGDGTMLVIPMHARNPVKPGLVLKVLKQAGFDPHATLDEI